MTAEQRKARALGFVAYDKFRRVAQARGEIVTLLETRNLRVQEKIDLLNEILDVLEDCAERVDGPLDEEPKEPACLEASIDMAFGVSGRQS